jgi:hypothetical protein
MTLLRMIHTDNLQGSGSGSGGGSAKPQKLCVPVDGYSWYCQYGQICGNREGVCLGVPAGGSDSGSGSGTSPTATGSTSSRTTSAQAVASSATNAGSSGGLVNLDSSSAAKGISTFEKYRNSFVAVMFMAVAIGGF